MESIKTSVETITRETAQEMLKNNTHNRVPRKNRIDFIEEQIKKGQFKFNGESIIISNTGKILDGQHRLMAVASCGIPIQSIVVRGVEDNAMPTIDTGTIRNGNDVLQMNNISNSSAIASFIKKIFVYKKGVKECNATKLKLTNNMILEFYKLYQDEIDTTIARVSNLSKASILKPTEKLFYTCIFTYENRILGEMFMNELLRGVSQSEDSPIILLREKLDYYTRSRAMTISSSLKEDLILKTWSLYKNNITVKSLRLPRGEKVKRPKTPFDEYFKNTTKGEN